MPTLNLPPPVGPALDQLKRELGKVYGSRLRGVYLYGSYARNEADKDSDVDVLIALSGLVQSGLEISRINALVSQICLQSDLLISTFPVSLESWEKGRSPFLMCVRKEAVPL